MCVFEEALNRCGKEKTPKSRTVGIVYIYLSLICVAEFMNGFYCLSLNWVFAYPI